MALPSWWTVLIGDPDIPIGDHPAERWVDSGATVTTCQDGASVLFEAGRQTPDLVLLAAVLPQLPVDVVVSVLRRYVTVPILLAVGPGDAQLLGDGLGRALLAGANEVISRPYTEGPGLIELNAHLARLRNHRQAEMALSIGSLHIDVARFEARAKQRSLELTVREFRILYFLMNNYDRAVSAQELQYAVWGAAGAHITSNTLAVHLARLRKSLGTAGQIKHIRNIGYRLSVTDAS